MRWHLDRLDRLCWPRSCNNRLPETAQDENRKGPRRERPGRGQEEARKRPGSSGRDRGEARKRPGRGREEARKRTGRGRKTSGRTPLNRNAS